MKFKALVAHAKKLGKWNCYRGTLRSSMAVCPIVAVHNDITGRRYKSSDYFGAARNLGLRRNIAHCIAVAADNSIIELFDSKVRSIRKKRFRLFRAYMEQELLLPKIEFIPSKIDKKELAER